MRRVLIIVLFYSVEGFLQFYPDIPLVERDDGDAGEPLILTPYVQSGNIEEGRRLAQVNIPGFENITSYSGFFTVDNANDSNIFFWYFPPMNYQYRNASIMIWLEGGPGASSLLGLFLESGPIGVEKEKLVARNYSWTQTRHMIYIDNPVGSGFSFIKSGNYCTNQDQIGEQLLSTMTQFFKLFPHLQGNDLYVTGNSYGGKFAPTLAYYIHKNKEEAEVKINLKGVIIGNGWSDPEHQLEYGELLYELGLIDSIQEAQLEETKIEALEFIKQKQWINASTTILDLYSQMANFTKLDIYNYVGSKDIDFISPIEMVEKTFFRKCIHVGESKFNAISSKVYENLKPDISRSVAPWIEELLDHYKVITYNGQLDIIVAYPLTVNYIKHLKFSGADEYKKAKREILYIEGEVAGYSKTAGNLTEIMIRDAGHAVPIDKPNWIYSIILKITESRC